MTISRQLQSWLVLSVSVSAIAAWSVRPWRLAAVSSSERQLLGSRPASAGRIGRDCRVRLRVGASRPVRCPLSGFCSSGKGRLRRPGTCSQRTSWRSCGPHEPARAELVRFFTLVPAAETFAWKIRGRDNVLGGSTLLDAAGCAVPPTPAMDDPRSTIERAERSFPRAISKVGRIDTSRA